MATPRVDYRERRQVRADRRLHGKTRAARCLRVREKERGSVPPHGPRRAVGSLNVALPECRESNATCTSGTSPISANFSQRATSGAWRCAHDEVGSRALEHDRRVAAPDFVSFLNTHQVSVDAATIATDPSPEALERAAQLHDAALASLAAGAVDEAVRIESECLALRPTAADVYHTLGYALFLAGDVRSAAEYFEFCLEIDRTSTPRTTT